MPPHSRLITLPRTLVVILVYAAATVWVTERWALSILEVSAFLWAATVALWIAFGKQSLVGTVALLPVAGMGLWGVVQLALHWTVVKAETQDAILYWLAAACLVWLGLAACASPRLLQAFLKAVLVTGSVICILGLLQQFTVAGHIFWLFPSGHESRVVGPFLSRNNYASFVELLLPIALVLGCQEGRNSKGYVVLAAAQVASVFAAGSRAGSSLVIGEVVVIFLLQSKGNLWGRAAIRFGIVLSAFTIIVGYQELWSRFSQDKDPYSMRREFLKSSLAMVRSEPLHGFGLGTWTSAYPQFAIIDTGQFANHAHNEWAQWAAEGGLPALALMFAVFLWAVMPAIQSVWGVGILSVMIHSWVDYPFVRLGLAAWIFVLLGALAAFKQLRRKGARPGLARSILPFRVLAGAAIPVLLIGILQASRVAWADTLYRRATIDSLQRATAIDPDRAEYEFALSQIETRRSVPHLERATALNPYFTKARIALALEVESAGDSARGEQILLEAARRDHQFAPAWALADYYVRTNQPNKFWPWARTAANISYGDLRPLFDLCFLVSEDSSIVFDRVAVLRVVQRQFLSYLITHERLPDAHAVALRIMHDAAAEDSDFLMGYIDAALAAGQIGPAREIWDQVDRRLMPHNDDSVITNGDFARPILNRGFDWRLMQVDGVVAIQTRDQGPYLSFSFSGKQPEQCELMAQFLPLTKGAAYVMRFQYKTADLPEHTGLLWSLGQGREYPLKSSEQWTSAEWRVLPSGSVDRLLLRYQRHLGTSRIEGALSMRNIRLIPDSVSDSAELQMEHSRRPH